jgi:hypothetical protein
MNVIEYRGKQVGELVDGEVTFLEGVHHKVKAAVLKSLQEDHPQDATGEADDSLPYDPEPEQDPKFGDKTLAWALWLKRNKPEEFEQRFFGRKIMLEKTETTNSGDDK